jgi:rod shape-determining protein MreC
MVLDVREHQLKRLRSALSLVILPVQYSVDIPHAIVEAFSGYFSSRATLMKETKLQHEQILALQRQVQRLSSLEAENTRLKILLKTNARPGDKVAVAEVMQVDMDASKQTVVINRGSLDDTYEGQPVVDSQGIVGQVISVGPASSLVLLITDKRHATPIQSERSGTRAIAMGAGEEGKLYLAHVTITSDFKIGDKIISSGLGQRFPKGYPVGEVVSIENDASDKFAKIEVRPYGKTAQLREVLLIWPEGMTSEAILERTKQAQQETKLEGKQESKP